MVRLNKNRVANQAAYRWIAGALTCTVMALFCHPAKAQRKPAQQNGAVSKQGTLHKANVNMTDTQEQFQLIPFRDREGKWGYLQRSTMEPRIPPLYLTADLFYHGLARVSVANPKASNEQAGSLYGWIDTTGKAIFEPQFTAIYDVNTFGNKEKIAGLKMVAMPDGAHGIIDLYKGEWLVAPGKFDDFFFYDRDHFLLDKKLFFADGKLYTAPAGCTITVVDQENRLFYIEKGNELHNGVATWEGEIIVPPKYMEINYIPDHHRYFAGRMYKSFTEAALIALLKSGDTHNKVVTALLDDKGNILGQYRGDYFADTYKDSNGNYSLGMYTQSDSNFYFSLETGKEVMVPEDANNKKDGYRLFKKAEHWGLMDRKEQVVIAPIYRQLAFVGNHLILATKAAGSYQMLMGVLDYSGHEVIAFKYTRLEYDPSQSGPGPHFNVYKDDKYGMIDPEGNVIIPIIYSSGMYFTGERAEVYRNYLHGVIDSHGKEVIPCIYKTIFSSKLQDGEEKEAAFSNTLPEYYRVENDAQRWALLDSAGKIVLPFDYGFVSVDERLLARGWVSIEDTARRHYGKYNIKTGVIIPPVYDIIQLFDGCIKVANRVGNDYVYQLLDENGKALSEGGYTLMDYKAGAGYFLCRKDGKYGVLNTKGQIILPLKYDYLWEEDGDLLRAEAGDAYFYIDLTGKEYKLATK